MDVPVKTFAMKYFGFRTQLHERHVLRSYVPMKHAKLTTLKKKNKKA